MGKRIDILNALYAHIPNVAGDSYESLKSEGNGAIAFHDLVNDACIHIKIMPEESTKIQTIYFKSAPLHITAYKRYALPVDPEDNDFDIEVVKSDLIEHITTGFKFCTPAMSTAGLNTLDYIRELEPEPTSGDGVAIKLEFFIKWYDRS